MEGFVEQVVKRDKTAKNLAIKIIAVFLLFAIPLTFVLLARFVAYLAMVGFFLFLGGLYAVWYVFTSQKVEFEYAVNGDTLDVAKVISLRRRKKVCSVEIKDIETLEKGDDNVKSRHFYKVYDASKNINNTKENYYAVFNVPARGHCMLVFNPNEDILQAMKPYMNRQLMVELFYKNRR